jgi:hypothetical protein
MRNATEISALLHDVRSILDARRDETGIDLRVPPDGFQEHDGWLTIFVESADPTIHAWDYVRTLGDAERVLRAKGVKQVVLLPNVSV